MKLYDNPRAPNPRRVRVFLAEKGVSIPTEPLDLGLKQHKTDAFTALNPLQRLPALELDDGSILTESVAICRYIEALHPTPPLFGTGALGQARVEMWNRRVELHLYLPVSYVFRHLHPAMKELEGTQVGDWGEVNKPRAADFIQLLDRELANRPFIAGDDFSIADITAMITVDFMKPAKLTVPEELTNLRRWHTDVSARPSAKA